MEKRRAVFRTNASATIGGGHVRRCLVLADSLIDAGWEVVFACGVDSTRVIPALRHRAFAMMDSKSFDKAVYAHARPVANADLLVIDDYTLDATFESACRSWVTRILVVDDLANRKHDCDVLLDPSPARYLDDYAQLVPDNCELLLGPSYALLGSGFRAAHRRRRAIGEVERIFINFGATDEANATDFVLDALREAKLEAAIDVVLGGSSPHLPAIRNRIARFRRAVSLHVDVEDMATLMHGADLAIGAGGVGALERCALGLPSVIFIVVDNQVANVTALAADGAALNWGRIGERSAADIASDLKRLCADRTLRARMSDAAAELVDGFGSSRVRASCYAPLRAKDGRLVSLRKARFDDCALMLAWQSEPGIRSYARNPMAPLASEHENWLRAKLGNPDCIFNIVLHGSEPAGILRFDRIADADEFEISILIAAERQQIGLGSCALEIGKRMLREARIVAVIHPENRTSIRMFERAGYRPAGSGEWVLEPNA